MFTATRGIVNIGRWCNWNKFQTIMWFTIWIRVPCKESVKSTRERENMKISGAFRWQNNSNNHNSPRMWKSIDGVFWDSHVFTSHNSHPAAIKYGTRGTARCQAASQRISDSWAPKNRPASTKLTTAFRPEAKLVRTEATWCDLQTYKSRQIQKWYLLPGRHAMYRKL